MIWSRLWFAGLVVVPDHPCTGAAVVVLVADPAATAVVVLVVEDQAAAALLLIVIASHDLAAGYLFGREVGLCANHRSPSPSSMLYLRTPPYHGIIRPIDAKMMALAEDPRWRSADFPLG
jgi:hypothetical protein